MRNTLPLAGLVGFLCLVPLPPAHAAEGATPTSSAPAQMHTPKRPSSALFEGAPGLQKTETTFDPATQTVTMKLLVQDPNGYFIPTLRRENFAVVENGQRQHN